MHTLPPSLSRDVADVFISTILPSPLSPPVTHQSISFCSTLQPLPTQDKWSIAYKQGPKTDFLFNYLHHYAPIVKLDIAPLAVTYRRVIAQNLLCIINDILVYLEPVALSSNYLCRIVVPLSLRCVIFDAMHSSPATCHMGEYKNPHRIKLRFIWHRMRKGIKVRIKQCPHYM